VLDFIVRHDLVADPDERAFSELVQANSAARGEPWVTYIDPDAFERDLTAMGFRAVERLTPALAAERYYRGQPPDVTPFTVWQVIAAMV
jgi:O-methyltransferase involved in polyketide biosynthesis